MSKKRRMNKTGKNRMLLNGADARWAERLGREMDAIVRPQSPPEGKVSDALSEFAEPLIWEYCDSLEGQVAILKFACLLWNMAIIRQSDRQKYSEMELVMMNALSGAPFFLDPADALNLTTFMVKRWENDYSWCKRFIVDKQIIVRNNTIHISVASIPIEL